MPACSLLLGKHASPSSSATAGRAARPHCSTRVPRRERARSTSMSRAWLRARTVPARRGVAIVVRAPGGELPPEPTSARDAFDAVLNFFTAAHTVLRRSRCSPATCSISGRSAPAWSAAGTAGGDRAEPEPVRAGIALLASRRQVAAGCRPRHPDPRGGGMVTEDIGRLPHGRRLRGRHVGALPTDRATPVRRQAGARRDADAPRRGR